MLSIAEKPSQAIPRGYKGGKTATLDLPSMGGLGLSRPHSVLCLVLLSFVAVTEQRGCCGFFSRGKEGGTASPVLFNRRAKRQQQRFIDKGEKVLSSLRKVSQGLPSGYFNRPPVRWSFLPVTQLKPTRTRTWLCERESSSKFQRLPASS